MGFPFEIITMLASTLLSSVLSLWSESRKAKQQEQMALITRGKFQLKAIDAARNVKSQGFQWTRRIIALVSVFAIVVFPLPDDPTNATLSPLFIVNVIPSKIFDSP